MARDAVAEVRDRTDVVELVSQYVSLKKAGRSYKGLCPFHQEKTPSFVVFPDSQNFHCFGCGRGGDVFSFYMGVERAEFREALQELAKRAGVQLSDVAPASPEVDAQRQRLIELNESAAGFFANILANSAAGAAGRDLAAQRGLSDEVIRRFQIGFAPDSWDGLLRFFAQRGVDPSRAVEAGLLQDRETGGHYDRFRNRLIFPIRDREGRTVGFGGRALGDAMPKYLNSPQTAVFDKSTLLYALDVAKEEIRAADQVVIVEGYMDALAAHQFGHRNVVAAMGTALTGAQISQIKRHTKRIVLALDADAAGQMATVRGLEAMQGALDHDERPVADAMGIVRFERKLNADIGIVRLPEGKDPDELIRRSPDAWPGIVASAQPFLAFLIETLVANVDEQDPRAKSEVIARLAPILRQVPDRVVQDHYVNLVAMRLRLDPRIVRSELRRSTVATRVSPGPRAEDVPSGSVLRSEDHLLALFLKHRAVCGELIARAQPQDLMDSRNRELLAVLADETIPELDALQLIAGLDDPLADHAERLLHHLDGTPSLLPGHIQREAARTMEQIGKERYAFLLRQLNADLATAERDQDAETVLALVPRLSELASRHRLFYPPKSPYFRDARDESLSSFGAR